MVDFGSECVKTFAYIFSGECDPFNCKCWVVEVVLSKEKPSTVQVWIFSGSVEVQPTIAKEYVKTELA
jgi:hypothetical protein